MNLVTFRTCLAMLASLALAATGAWASPAAEEAPAAAMEKEMVLDPTTGEMVLAPSVWRHHDLRRPEGASDD